MHKKKEKSSFRFVRLVARVWIISMPAAIILAILLLWGKISLPTAGLLFLGVLIFTTVLTTSVFKELENFISYLRKLAQGIEIEPPKFKKGVFSPMRLGDTFQSVKKIWSNQTLSDSTILENLPEPMIMLNDRGQIVFMNQRAQQVFGEMQLNRDFRILMTETAVKNAVGKVLKEQQATERFEWGYDSYVFQVRADRLPALTRNGAVAVITMTDITPFKRFREQQIEFFANASHELKTPLSIISGLIETLQGAAKDDEAVRSRFLNMMAEQTGRMTGLVGDLLKLARQQAVTGVSRKEPVAVQSLVSKVMADLKHKAEQNRKKLKVKTEGRIPKMMGNPEELRHVFQNLIDNAIKYGDPGSVVSVKIRALEAFPNKPDDKRSVIMVAVHNVGSPIAGKDLDKLFDRFYRVDSVQVQRVEGSGLGLSIVQQIVQDHDGVIDVASSAKDGTTFSVYLPVV